MITINNNIQGVNKLLNMIIGSGLTPVFDLDGVWLDARHRQATKPDGSLDLEAYRANSNYSNVMQDKALDLSNVVQTLNAFGVEYYCLTARPVCEGTRDKVIQHLNARPVSIMGRNGNDDNRRDYELKHDWLSKVFSPSQLKHMILIDDNAANCQVAINLGMIAVHVPFDGH